MEPAPAPVTTPDVARRQLVEQVIADGERKLKAIFPSKELKHHLDTLTRPQYLNLDLTYDRLRFINSYTKSLKPRLTDSEISQVYNSLTITNSALLNDIDKRLDQLK